MSFRVEILFLVFCARTCGQHSGAAIVLDDLQERLLASLRGIARAENKSQAESQGPGLRRELEARLGLRQLRPDGFSQANVFVPEHLNGPTPAILVLTARGHERIVDSTAFVSSSIRLGVIVMTLDVTEGHKNLSGLYAGVPPQGWIQSEVRAALQYLRSRADVDSKRIGLIGVGFLATVAAALNPDLSPVVIIDGDPGLADEVVAMRNGERDTPADPCLLISGLAKLADGEEFLALIAPRPLLLVNPSLRSLEYANSMYMSFGEPTLIRTIGKDVDVREQRIEMYRWLARWLLKAPLTGEFVEPEATQRPIPVSFPAASLMPPVQRPPLRTAQLADKLGPALPEGKFGFRLNVGLQQKIWLTTQRGFDLPVIVLRPGPRGDFPEAGTLVAIADDGKESLVNDPVVQEAVKRNWIVWIVDPRGLGELRSDRSELIFAWSLLLAENFVWRQALDIYRIVWEIGQLNSVRRSSLYARGPMASVIATYVAAMIEGDTPAWVAIRDPMKSFSNAADLPSYVIPFDAMNLFDINDLLAIARPRIVHVVREEDFIRSDW
jgi:hypothetical protein